MKLEDVVSRIEELQETQRGLEQQKQANENELAKLGKAIFSVVRESQGQPAGTPRIEFQVGPGQYQIEGNGTLKRINEIDQVEASTEIVIE